MAHDLSQRAIHALESNLVGIELGRNRTWLESNLVGIELGRNRTWLESNLVVFRFAAMLHLEPLFSISSSCFARCGSQNSSFRQGVAESQ